MAGAAWPYRPPTLRHTWPYRAPCPTLRPTPSLRHTHRQGCPLAQGDLCPAQEEARGESEGSPRGVRGGPSQCGWLEESASSVAPA